MFPLKIVQERNGLTGFVQVFIFGGMGMCSPKNEKMFNVNIKSSRCRYRPLHSH